LSIGDRTFGRQLLKSKQRNVSSSDFEVYNCRQIEMFFEINTRTIKKAIDFFDGAATLDF